MACGQFWPAKLGQVQSHYIIYMHSLTQRPEVKTLESKIIKIQLNLKNDIKILWNFSGLLMPKVFRRHVFISLSWKEDQIIKAQRALQSCYKLFKLGDLYSFAVPNEKCLEWFEKTKISQFTLSTPYNNKSRDYYTKMQLLSLKKYSEPCFVVLFCDPDYQIQELQDFILELRQKEKFNCMVFIVSARLKSNSVNFSNGIFRIEVKQSEFYDIEAIYKFYNDHLACLYADLSIESQSGDIFLEKGTWRSHSFTSFSHRLYYPLANNYTDILETHKLYSEKASSWKFKIKLEYRLLNGETYSSTKMLEVPLQKDIEKLVTYNPVDLNPRKYSLFLGTEVEENPFYKCVSLESGIGFSSL